MPKRPLPDDNPPRQSTRMLRSKRPATAPTVMSLLATATAFLSPTEVPADAKHLPVEIINRITLIIAARKDKATLLTLMRVGKTWNRTAAVHIYRTLDFGERDASAIIWGLDRTICWNLPWGEMDRSGHNIFGNGYLEERSPTKIAALSLVQHIVLRLDELHDVWGEWVVDQMSKADGLFGAVESLRIIQKTEPGTAPPRHHTSIFNNLSDWYQIPALLTEPLLERLYQSFSTEEVTLDFSALRSNPRSRPSPSLAQSLPKGCRTLFSTVSYMRQAKIDLEGVRVENGNHVMARDILQDFEVILDAHLPASPGLQVIEFKDFGLVVDSAKYDGGRNIVFCRAAEVLASTPFKAHF